MINSATVAMLRIHKDALIQMMARRSGQPALSKELFLLHEGASAAWPLVGMQAIQAAQSTALKLLKGDHYD